MFLRAKSEVPFMADIIIYMINKGKLKQMRKAVFTTGDSYIVVDKPGEKVFIWLGSKCSADEKGVAAIEARRIDDGKLFNGSAKIITFDEGDESAEFLSKLDGLRILDKNMAKSMLKDVSTGEFAGEADHVNALYRVSSEEYDGINAMKFKQVPFKKSSLDSEDVFIADLGVDIYVWQGKTSNVKEKVKAIQFARQFDAERAGAQRPVVMEEGDQDEHKFLGIFDGKLPQSESKVKDFKLEKFDEVEKKKKKEKKGLCAYFIGIVMLAVLLL